MTLDLSGELNELVDEIAHKHEDPAPGELPSCWSVLVDLGLPCVGIGQHLGGSGGSLSDLVTIARALGRNGLSSPFVEAATANWALALGGRPCGSGLNTVTLDLRRAVPWARHAEHLVAALAHDAVATSLRGIPLRRENSIAGEPVDHLSYPSMVFDELDGVATSAIQARLGILRSAALVGAVGGAYQMTREYVAVREQFGQPLIRIPAVAANLARMRAGLLQCEAALTRAQDERLESAAAVRVLAALTATEVARLAHQLHGAMGITAEYGLHRYTEKLWAWRDADRDQRDWSLLLARQAIAGGEAVMWERLTS